MSNSVSERLSEIRERVEAATEGPWGVKDMAVDARSLITGGDGHNVGHVFDTSKGDQMPREANAEWIASARSDVPYLLSLVEEVGEALASLSATEIDGLLGAVEYQNPENSDRLVKALVQVRDAALKAEYEEQVE